MTTLEELKTMTMKNPRISIRIERGKLFMESKQMEPEVRINGGNEYGI